MSTTRIYLNDTLHVMGNVVSPFTNAIYGKRTYHARKFVQPQLVIQKQLCLFGWVGHVGASTVTKMKAAILHVFLKKKHRNV